MRRKIDKNVWLYYFGKFKSKKYFVIDFKERKFLVIKNGKLCFKLDLLSFDEPSLDFILFKVQLVKN